MNKSRKWKANDEFSFLARTFHFLATVCRTFRYNAIGPLSYPVCPVCDVGVLWPNGWMDQDETWHGGRPRSWPHCVRWGPSSPLQRGTAPNFRPMSVTIWYDTIRWTILTCAQKLTSSQLSLPHGTKQKKNNEETKTNTRNVGQCPTWWSPCRI